MIIFPFPHEFNGARKNGTNFLIKDRKKNKKASIMKMTFGFGYNNLIQGNKYVGIRQISFYGRSGLANKKHTFDL